MGVWRLAVEMKTFDLFVESFDSFFCVSLFWIVEGVSYMSPCFGGMLLFGYC